MESPQKFSLTFWGFLNDLVQKKVTVVRKCCKCVFVSSK